MFWIDTHAHLYDECFSDDLSGVIARARSAGVARIILPNCDEEIGLIQGFTRRDPHLFYAAYGLHPTYVNEEYPERLRCIEESIGSAAEEDNLVAVGEVGLDYYWSTDFASEQREAFRLQCQWANRYGLPLIIHAREAMDDVLDIICESEFKDIPLVLHALQCTHEQLDGALERERTYFGLGGMVTFRKANPAGLIERIPLERAILETDAPYLTPVPHRGKRNESAYIPIIGAALSAIWGVPLEEIRDRTTQNALELFPGIRPGAEGYITH